MYGKNYFRAKKSVAFVNKKFFLTAQKRNYRQDDKHNNSNRNKRRKSSDKSADESSKHAKHNKNQRTCNQSFKHFEQLLQKNFLKYNTGKKIFVYPAGKQGNFFSKIFAKSSSGSYNFFGD